MIMVFSLMIYFVPSSYFVRYLIFESEKVTVQYGHGYHKPSPVAVVNSYVKRNYSIWMSRCKTAPLCYVSIQDKTRNVRFRATSVGEWQSLCASNYLSKALWQPFQETRLYEIGAVHGCSIVAVRGDRRSFHVYHKSSPVAVVNSYVCARDIFQGKGEICTAMLKPVNITPHVHLPCRV
jgi:hypothetical protein